ncbi:MAG: TonB-dependent receptor [Gammaproteobacteria bacterium]|nr:TonB-dependent receptor [Gammaproteobacteria bacterium]
MNESRVTLAASAISLAVALALQATTARQAMAAPQADDPPLSEVVVTGSRIQRSDASSVGPLTTLNAADIAAAAPTSAGDLLQALPSVGVSLNSNGTQGTSFGVSSINLRYLGSAEGSGNRTLVLVDGHRWVNAVGGRGFRDFVDLNTIPLGIIDSIEVLKDGASAIYGADAIAGVVNIKTKRNFEGFEVSGRYGITDRDDNENLNGFLNWGARSGAASWLVSLSYNDSKPVRTDARTLTTRALAPLTAPPTSPRGLYVLPGLSNNAYFGTPLNFAANAANSITRLPDVTTIGAGNLADNSFRVATLPNDDYNTQAQGIYAIGPSERLGAFLRGGYQFGETLEGHLELLYNERRSSQLFSPVLLDVRGSNGFSIARDQAFNPFGTANGVPLANALAFTGSTFRAQRVLSEVGNRDNQQEVKTVRIAAGLEGTANLAGEWRWDAFLSWSRNEATFDALNQVNFESIFRSLQSPAICSAAPGCTPLNIFGQITAPMADYIRYNGHDEQEATQVDFALNASRSLFDLPAGTVGFATGYEYRKEKAVDVPDAFAATLSSVLPTVAGTRQAPTTAQSRDPTSGAYDLHELYAEISAPLLADLPLVHSLDVDAAIRYSNYSTVGGETTAKFGVAYRPVESLLLRGTYSQGFRAPSILELYQGTRNTNFQAVDPCNGGGAGKPGCTGIPTSYNQNQFGGGTINGVVAGNPNLQPETADTLSLGISLTPRALPGLSWTVDWFKIEVSDAIASQTATQLLQACALRQTYCDLINRAPSGEVLLLRQAVVNLSSIEVSGVDSTLRYDLDTDLGRFSTVLDVSYLDRFRTQIVQPDGSVTIDDRAGKSDQPRSTFPRVKGQAGLRYSRSGFEAGYKARYIGSSSDVPGNAVNGGNLRAITYHDLQLAYSFGDAGYRVAVGVDNVTDRQPPASAANNPINFDIYTYDIRGRYLYATFGVKF